MVSAKNYEIVSTFVKVMQKKRWPLFSGHGSNQLYCNIVTDCILCNFLHEYSK